ncbi:hypothetical protein BDY17DRAFT_324601 [Neohortaea acidophila]|uniref:RBR-type E3 ubiquitin transferase n=1 Tax=Neohortaea acidophila TaxID=245834 RepID=A0A6A6PQC5_9PEZI|nr:uncharacterized protein BDY17DRAFT_324601 [Neohortaea acidophila]KAF2482310.1 hypothetical protein BDY17DRAFT_324601 [Neohortaea acidophila]
MAAQPNNSAGPRTQRRYSDVLRQGTASTASRRIPMFTCIVCEDDFSAKQCYRHICNHTYCHEDLRQLVRTSLTASGLFPPECCYQPIPFDEVKRFLGEELIREYGAKLEELGDAKPVYCHVAACGAYIGKGERAEESMRATCQRCGAATCVLCRQEGHEGDCSAQMDDEAAKQFRQLAKEKRWQTCPKCRRTVERAIGCNQITCLCGAQFCYLCGTPWKHCECADEGDGFDDEQYWIQVACTDAGQHDWEHRSGPNTCDLCGQVMPAFVFECQICRRQRCRRCREYWG